MATDFKLVEQPGKPLAMNARKFALWLFIITVVMIFASLTSAYIVRQAEGNWLEFQLPVELYYSTAILILSSVTMQWAYMAAKRDALDQVKMAISVTSLLGLMFVAMQVYVFGVLVDMSVYLVGNPSGSFLYILMGLHGLHLISGVIFLLVVLADTFRYKVHSKNLNRIQMCNTYWHFLDILWVYLLVFLLLNH